MNKEDYNDRIRRLLNHATDTITVMLRRRLPARLWIPFLQVHRIVFAELESIYFGFDILPEDYPNGDPRQSQDWRPYRQYWRAAYQEFMNRYPASHLEMRRCDESRIQHLSYTQVGQPGEFLTIDEGLQGVLRPFLGPVARDLGQPTPGPSRIDLKRQRSTRDQNQEQPEAGTSKRKRFVQKGDSEDISD